MRTMTTLAAMRPRTSSALKHKRKANKALRTITQDLEPS